MKCTSSSSGTRGTDTPRPCLASGEWRLNTKARWHLKDRLVLLVRWAGRGAPRAARRRTSWCRGR
eukprot:1255292-Prymnesium_polylepis.1